MVKHLFSPIGGESTFNEALEYTAEELRKLCIKVLGETLPIDTLKVFSHYFDEYDLLEGIVSSKGPKSKFTQGMNYYSNVDLTISGEHILWLGVRKPDPYRSQVGCGDFSVADYDGFKDKYLDLEHGYVREIMDDRDMLEIWHPDFDVLGYVIPSSDHTVENGIA
jgi:hypothetical protein